MGAEEVPVDFVIDGEVVPWEGVEPGEPVAGELVFAVGEGFGPWDGEGFADALGVGAVFGEEPQQDAHDENPEDDDRVGRVTEKK